MKNILLLLLFIGSTTLSFSQNDTVRIGNMVIVKSPTAASADSTKTTLRHWRDIASPAQISVEKKKYKQTGNVNTSYLEWDLGFANYQNETPNNFIPFLPVMNSIPNSTYLKLNNLKSSNINLWFVKQQVNIYKHYANLKYAVGIEMYNLRFEQPISFRNDNPSKMYMDNISFSKNKLFLQYLTVPVQLDFKTNPGSKKGLNASIGMSAGYLINARNKQISDQRGKQKYEGTFNLNNWRIATIGEIGMGNFRLYGTYSRTNLFDETITNYKFFPYAIGIRFAKF